MNVKNHISQIGKKIRKVAMFNVTKITPLDQKMIFVLAKLISLDLNVIPLVAGQTIKVVILLPTMLILNQYANVKIISFWLIQNVQNA